MKRLLAILAHPDDESFAIGGTLARYAAEGVDVHVAIATDGVAGSVVEGFEGSLSQLVAVRMKELDEATAILGVTLHRFCYRDSGYIGDPANDHPDAFVQADQHEAVGRVVKLIREIRPQVVITHDETGGYFHPDHIQCWKITVPAFHAAGDADQYPELELEPYQPQRLFFNVIPNSWIKLMTFFMRLRGQDPTKMGRNKDIDMTRIGVSPRQIQAAINLGDYWDTKREAGARHPSQGGGGGFTRHLPMWFQKKAFGKESFMLGFPVPKNGDRFDDLFSGVEA